METLYRLRATAPAFTAATLNAGGSPLVEPVKALADAAAMTAMCLMDALCDFEHSAGFRRGFREAGGCHEDNPAADLGDLLCELRSEEGSYSLRQRVLDMVATVDAAWDRVNADDACDGQVCFDFEFCPEAIRLHFQMGLTGADLEDALVNWGRDAIDAADARWAAQKAKQDRAEAIAKAQAGLAQAEAALAALLAAEAAA
jgi:hypothetical protein